MKIKRNIISLYGLRLANQALPLIYIPYLLKTLGTSEYGILAFCLGICAITLPLIDYGFNLTATRDLANSDDSIKDSGVATSILWAKLSITFGLIAPILIVAQTRPENELGILFITYISIALQSLFPAYIFQAKREMTLIAILSIGSRLISIACIFIFVKNKGDAVLVPLSNTLGSLLAVLVSYILISKKYQIYIGGPVAKNIYAQMKIGGNAFLANTAATLYNVAGTISLGYLSSNESVAIYSLAEKALQLTKGIYLPFIQAIYPDWSQAMKTKNSKLQKTLFSSLLILLTFLCLIVPILIYASTKIPETYLQTNSETLTVLLGIILCVAPFDFIRNIAGNLILLNNGHDRFYSNIMLSGCIFGALLVFLLTFNYQAVGAANGLLIVEVTLTTILSIKAYKTFRCQNT